jgi:hypothetical protein
VNAGLPPLALAAGDGDPAHPRIAGRRLPNGRPRVDQAPRCELGSNVTFVVLDDADLDRVTDALASAGYTNSGLSRVSAQKVDRFVPGDPANTTLASLITDPEGDRVVRWLREPRDARATILRGGDRDRSLVEAAVAADPPADSQRHPLRARRQRLRHERGPRASLRPGSAGKVKAHVVD